MGLALLGLALLRGAAACCHIRAAAAAPLPVQKPAPAKQTFPLPTPRKETHTTATIQEKELKKNETPSTLSFNIFLYIVDKFKADHD